MFFDSKNQPRSLVNSRGKKRKPGAKNLSYMIGTDEKDFIDFLTNCFLWPSDHRMKPHQAAEHEWIRQKKSRQKTLKSIGDERPKTLGKSNSKDQIKR